MKPLTSVKGSARSRLRGGTALLAGGSALLLVLLAVTSVSLSLSQRQTGRGDLYRFVSPPLDAEGTRFEFLCPRGWHRRPGPGSPGRSAFYFRPVDQFAAVRHSVWVPFVVKQWLPGPAQGELYVLAGLVDPRRKPQVDNDRVAVYPSPHSSSALRFVLSEDERYVLHIKYTRQTPSSAEQAAFRSTYEPVLRSLKITEKTTAAIP